ncbi:MAG: hypothetical protein ACIAQZ_01330 [Sedimentisphaeraceae bacterium JB056]
MKYIALILLAFSNIYAQSSSDCWQGRYDADTVPNTGQWSVSGWGVGWDQSFDAFNGIIHIDTTGKDAGLIWNHEGNDLDFAQGATIEIRAKNNLFEGGGAAMMNFYDSADRGCIMELASNGFNITNCRFTALDTQDDFHTYRITIQTGSDGVKLYYDGDDQAVGVTTLYSGYTGLNRSGKIQFGDMTGANDADWELDYIRWISGVYLPSEWSGGDYNQDCFVDMYDYRIVASYWLDELGMDDLDAVAVNWLQGRKDSFTLYITDMSIATPATSISQDAELGKWQVIDYESLQISGKMLSAPSYIDAPEITIPVPQDGYYGVYVGYWNPGFNGDGDSCVKLRLSGEPGFNCAYESVSRDTQDSTYLREAFFGFHNLTGNDIVIGKDNGIAAKKTFIAYLKLVPVTEDFVSSYNSSTNSVTAVFGRDYFSKGEFTTVDDYRRLIKPLVDTDVNRVLWPAASGFITDFKSSLTGAVYRSDAQSSVLIETVNENVIADKQEYETYSSLSLSQTSVCEIVSDVCSEYSVDLGLIFEMGIAGGVPNMPLWSPDSLVELNPGYRQITYEGKFVNRASYAYSSVQTFMINLINEAISEFSPESICLDFRGQASYIRFEQPFVVAFYKTYGVDPRNIDSSDSRIAQKRADIMNGFLSDIRAAIDGSIGITAIVSEDDLFADGIDIDTWITSGSIDELVYSGQVDSDLLALCQTYGCQYSAGSSEVTTDIVQSVFTDGANRFAFFDAVERIEDADIWNYLKYAGHSEYLENIRDSYDTTDIKLYEVGGINVYDGIADAIYSGG